MKYIKRAIEDIVLRSEKTFKSILVTGARQTGKKEMIKHLFPDKKYVVLDDPFAEEQASKDPDTFMMLNPPPVILDEVQRVPNLFRYVKMECEIDLIIEENGVLYPVEIKQNSSPSADETSAFLILDKMRRRSAAREP